MYDAFIFVFSFQIAVVHVMSLAGKMNVGQFRDARTFQHILWGEL
jgi:hypothetical protein